MSFRSQLSDVVGAVMNGEFSQDVIYNGKTIKAIARIGKSAADGTGFGSDGSSTDGTLRVLLSDVEPCEGDLVVIDDKSWSVAREISRTFDTALLEIHAEQSVFGGRREV